MNHRPGARWLSLLLGLLLLVACRGPGTPTTLPPSATHVPSPPPTLMPAAGTATALPTSTPVPLPTALPAMTPTPVPVLPTTPATVDELPAPPLSLAVDPFDQQGAYALLADDTLYHTIDGGTSWQKLSLPVAERPPDTWMDPARPNAPPVWPQRDLAVTRIQPSRLFVRAGQTLYRRDEEGSGWKPLLDRVNAWAIDEGEGRLLYAWRVGTPTAADRGGKETHGLFVSEDGGESWAHVYRGFFPPSVQDQDLPPSQEGISSLAIDPAMPNGLYAGADDGLYRSLDRGRTWARFEGGLPETAGAQRWVPLLAGGMGSGPLFALTELSPTEDGTGAQAILARLERGAISPDQDRWQVVGQDALGMLASSERGFWGVHTLAVDPTQPRRLYLGSEWGLWRSENGGETWMPADLGGGMDPVPNGAVYRIAVRFGQETELYLWSDTGLSVNTLSTPAIPASAISDEVRFEVIGQMGGQSRAVAVTSDTVYLSIGPRIATLDRALRPGDAGLTPALPGMVNDMALDEEKHIAYVAGGQAGLLIVDLSAGGGRVLGQLETHYEAQAVAVHGDLALVVEGRPGGKGGMSIVNVALPELPWLVSWRRLPGPGRDGWLGDGYAYLIVESGLIAMDLADPANPVETARAPLPQCGGGIVVEGGHAYVAADGLYVYDLASPALPRQVGHFPTIFCPFALAVQDGRAYLADVFCEFGSCGSTLHIVDVQDPSQPVEVGTWTSPSAVEDLAVSDGTTYLASWQQGVEAVDVRDPAHAGSLGAYGTLGEVTDVAVEGGFAYVSDGAGSGLRVLDLTASPGAAWPGVRGTAEMRWAGGSAVANGLAYVPVWSEGIRIVDVRDPDAPRELSTLDVGMAAQAAIGGDLAYVSVYDGLAVLDVADPAAPRVLARAPLDGMAQGLAVREGIAYVAVEGSSEGEPGMLYAIDLSSVSRAVAPGPLRQRGAVRLDGSGRRIALAGDLACVAVFDGSSSALRGGLQVIDLSDPGQPRTAGFLALPAGALDVAVAGRWALIAGGEAGVYAADLSNPADLRLAGHLDTPGSAQRVVIADGQVYVADGAGGLLALWMAVP